MTEDDFLAWRDMPVTKWVMSAFKNVAEANEAIAKEHAWRCAIEERGHEIDGHLLTVLAEKAKAYRAVFEADHEMISSFSEGEYEHERD